MPGLIGLSAAHLGDDASKCVSAMLELIAHQPFHKSDELFTTEEVCAARVHTDIIQRDPQPSTLSSFQVWIDGELYNQPELSAMTDPSLRIASAHNDAALLAALYQSDPQLSFLRHVDGIFSAVIVDAERSLVHLVTDRYGLRHLYYFHTDKSLAWASEVKAFLAIPEFTCRIDAQSVDDFFSVGYLLDNRTWLRGVTLLAPGSVLTFNIRSSHASISQYWNWRAIKPRSEAIDEPAIAAELGRLFSEAVRRQSRSERDAPVGLTLSGGLDSRAILAAMPSAEPAEPIHAFTFGKPGCDDIRLARDVARTKGASHHVIELDRQNWLVERIPAVWWSDGQFNLLHMHGVESLDQQRNYYRINLNGFLGDAVLGGSYIKPGAPALTDTVDSRGRRFIIEGPALANNFIHTRIPFFANKLMEFTCSLPMSLLAESYIYCKMLLALFPEYYTTIPWQTTGVAISCPKSVEAAFSVLRRVRGKYYRLTGQSSRSTQLFTDYAEWIRQPPACALFEDFMLLSNPLHREYLPKLCAATLWREHVRGQDHSDQLCRILTFELWLQQLYNKAYRPSALT